MTKYTGFKDSADVRKWARKFVSPNEDVDTMLLNSQIDHVIPVYWYKWQRNDAGKLEYTTVFANENVTRMMHKDNLQILRGLANQSKGSKLPSVDTLNGLKHIWPLWWQDKIPASRMRKYVQEAAYRPHEGVLI